MSLPVVDMLLYWGIGLFVLIWVRSDRSRGGTALRILTAIGFFILGVCHYVYPGITF